MLPRGFASAPCTRTRRRELLQRWRGRRLRVFRTWEGKGECFRRLLSFFAEGQVFFFRLSRDSVKVLREGTMSELHGNLTMKNTNIWPIWQALSFNPNSHLAFGGIPWTLDPE